VLLGLLGRTGGAADPASLIPGAAGFVMQ
jgi:hypothetical protein